MLSSNGENSNVSAACCWRAALFLAGVSLFGIGAPVAAQETAPEQEAAPGNPTGDLDDLTQSDDDTIVVTARRRNESVQDVPITMSALGEETLESFGVDNSADVGRLVGGVNWRTNSTDGRSQIFIRGVGSNSGEFSSAPAVAVYLDDTYLNAQPLIGFASFDMDRVEILKGPQGTLYGRNTTGGAIKFIPNKPRIGGALSTDASADIGNFNYIRATAGISIPLGDTAALRVAGVSVNRGGMYRDYLHGGRLVERDSKAIRTTLRIEPTENFSIEAMGTWGRSRSDTARYKRIDYVDPATITFPPLSAPVYSGVCANPGVGTAPGCTNLLVFGQRMAPDTNGDHYEVQSNLRRGQSPGHNDVLGGQLTLNYDFGGAALTSVSSYFRSEVLDSSDIDATALNFLSFQDVAEAEQLSQEIRLASTGDPDFRYVMGLYYFEEDLYSNSPAALRHVPIGFGSDYDQWSQAMAVFGEGSYRIAPALDLTVGARYSSERKRVDFRHFFFRPDQRPVLSYDDARSLNFFEDLNLKNLTDKDNNVSGRINLSYKASKDILFYASVNRGFKSGAFNVGADSVDTATFVDPEIVDAFEVGIKSQFLDRRITFNLSGYYYDYNDKQESIFDTGVERVSNAQARVYGIDGEIALRPVGGLTLASNFSFLDAKYAAFDRCTPTGGSCTGNRLPGAPEFSAHSYMAYELAVGGREVTLQADASYRTATYGSPINQAYERQGAYWLFGARATAELSEGLEVGAWIKNLANKRYFLSFFDVSQVGFSLALPGEPRTFGVTLRGRY